MFKYFTRTRWRGVYIYTYIVETNKCLIQPGLWRGKCLRLKELIGSSKSFVFTVYNAFRPLTMKKLNKPSVDKLYSELCTALWIFKEADESTDVRRETFVGHMIALYILKTVCVILLEIIPNSFSPYFLVH